MDAEGERVLLTDIAARFIRHGQSVPVRIREEADVRPGGAYLVTLVFEVCFRWFERVREAAVGFGAGVDEVASQLIEQVPAEQGARGVIRIQKDFETLASDSLDVHRCQNQSAVLTDCVVADHDVADPVMSNPGRLTGAISFGHRLARRRGQNPALLAE